MNQNKKIVKTNLNTLKSVLGNVRQCCGELPSDIWIDTRTDSLGIYAAIRAITKHSQVSLRIPNAEVVGDNSDLSFPFITNDFVSLDIKGDIDIVFCPSHISIVSASNSAIIDAIPYSTKVRPFPCNGVIEIPQNYGDKIDRFLDVVDNLGLPKEIRARFHKDAIQFYAWDDSCVCVCKIEGLPNESPILWDVSIPYPILKYISQYGAFIDHINNTGTWISDGFNYYYASTILDEVPYDTPGLIRAVKAFSNRMIINSDCYDALLENAYNLISVSSGCADVYSIQRESLYFDKDAVLGETKYIQVPYRGEQVGTILDSKVVESVCNLYYKGMVFLTDCLFSPYVISDGIVDVGVVPPLTKPKSVSKCFSNQYKKNLESIVSDTNVSMKAFTNTKYNLSKLVYPNVPSNTPDSLFLIHLDDSFIRAGGVSKEQLSLFMFEMGNTDIYSRLLIDNLNNGNYWVGLNIYVYDPLLVSKYGADSDCRYKDWITWDYFSDPEHLIVRDSKDHIKSEAFIVENKPRLRLSVKSFSAPDPNKSVDYSEGPDDIIDSETIIDVESYFEEKELKMESTAMPTYDYVLLDSNYVTWRDFHQKALKVFKMPVTGRPTGVVLGFMKSIKAWLRGFKPKRILAVWDAGIAPWRRELYPEYKKKDKSKVTVDELASIDEQREWIREGLPYLGVKSIKVPNTEADDIIALLADSLSKQGKVLIITGDHDYYHIVSDNVHVWNDRKDELIDTTDNIDSSLLKKAIIGDASDNIKGVPGVGAITLDKIFEGMILDKLPITVENIMTYASNSGDNRVKKLNKPESLEVLKRNIELIDLKIGKSKLPIETMIKVIQESVAEYPVDIMGFGRWASNLHINSISEGLSDWQRFTYHRKDLFNG